MQARLKISRRRWLTLMIATGLGATMTACGGGGGGGGGGGATATVKGTVLSVETNTAYTPPATITIGGQATTVQADGTFTISNAPASAKQASVAATGAQPRTLTIALTAGQTTDLGTIYLTSDTAGYTATVTGRIVTQDTNQPVGNATVQLAGATAVTSADPTKLGTFQIDNLPVGLGNVSGTYGKVTANGFSDKPITDETLRLPLAAGANPLGDIPIASPVGSTPPTGPYTIAGSVTVQGAKPSAAVTIVLTNNGNTLATISTDANGGYSFWVVPGTYTVQAALSGYATKQINVTLQQLNTPVTAPTINLTP